MKKNMIRMIVCMIAATLLLSTTAIAAYVDLDKECALHIDYTYNDKPVVGAKFDVYRVGEISRDGYLSLSGEFKDYPVVVNGLDDAQFQVAADTLASYATLNEHTPLVTLTTDAGGSAGIVGIKTGIYLIIGHDHKTDEGTYTVKNQLQILPYSAVVGNSWDYELTLKPKVEFEPATPDPLKVQIVKVWNDADNSSNRPASVTVHLLRDGEKYDTVVLEQANNWRYEWNDLDRFYSWSVAEDVPSGYTVALSLVDNTFIITNTSETPPSPTPTPPPIPQTGQVWWPVPVLLLLGVALIAMGIMWRKEDEV